MKRIIGIAFLVMLSFGFFVQSGLASSTLQKITVALNQVNLEVNGDKVYKDTINYNGTTYVPLRAIGEILNKDIGWDSVTKTASVNDKGFVNSPLVQSKNGLIVEVTKVEQDNDSLKVHIKYTNNTSEEVFPAESLSRIVVNGKQYDYDFDFNFDRYYETGVPKASYELEPGVTANSIIFFQPVLGAEELNLSVSPNYDAYKFNNISID